MFQLNKNSILVGVAVLAIIVTGCLLLININPNAKALLLGFGMSGETVANNAVAYINQNLLQEGQTASLESFSALQTRFPWKRRQTMKVPKQKPSSQISQKLLLH